MSNASASLDIAKKLLASGNISSGRAVLLNERTFDSAVQEGETNCLVG